MDVGGGVVTIALGNDPLGKETMGYPVSVAC